MIKKLLAPNLSSKNLTRKLFLVVFLLVSLMVHAHGDLTIRIEQKTEEISKKPNDFTLYFERGFLYQQHNEYDHALKDYLKSEALGNKDKVLFFRKAEAYYLNEELDNGMLAINDYLAIDSIDVKAKKLQAQLLFSLNKYDEALLAYTFVFDNMLDIRPEDIIEYCDIILSVNNKNYNGAINAIDLALNKLGEDTFSLQLKKLDYLIASNQAENTINQFNYFIEKFNRKEFWYYKKAQFLYDVEMHAEATIALQQAATAISQLNLKFQSMKSVKELEKQIAQLEEKLNLQKS
ncbi:hypothetical protein VP395_15385 [Mariniflexile soesokkakense]|uniref:Tetratricopeptide repeat protein n=1 Tax=Mariniflexile soesokkakense TaxID=1343160 RepID=A0ABV0AGT7_9FLAO